MTCRMSSLQPGLEELILKAVQKREAFEFLKKEVEILEVQGHRELAVAKYHEAVDLLDEEKLLMIEMFRQYREQIYERGKRAKHMPASKGLRRPSCPAQLGVDVVTCRLAARFDTLLSTLHTHTLSLSGRRPSWLKCCLPSG